MITEAADSIFTAAMNSIIWIADLFDSAWRAIVSIIERAFVLPAPRSAFLDEMIRQAREATADINNVGWAAAKRRQRMADADARAAAREDERAARWSAFGNPIAPDVIKISGQFTNLPDDWINQGTSYYTMRQHSVDEVMAAAAESDLRASGYHTGAIQALPDAEPVITVRCQYCSVGGQNPNAGICGRCGGPFPEMPSVLAWPPAPRPAELTIPMDSPPPGGLVLPATLEITRDAAGRISGITAWPDSTTFGKLVK